MAMKLTIEKVQSRLNRLRINPVENARLIKKWERKERKIKNG